MCIRDRDSTGLTAGGRRLATAGDGVRTTGDGYCLTAQRLYEPFGAGGRWAGGMRSSSANYRLDVQADARRAFCIERRSCAIRPRRGIAEGMHRLETARPGDAAEVCTSGRLLSGDLVDTIVEHDHHEVRHVRRDDRSERAEVHEQRTISTAHDHALAWLRCLLYTSPSPRDS